MKLADDFTGLNGGFNYYFYQEYLRILHFFQTRCTKFFDDSNKTLAPYDLCLKLLETGFTNKLGILNF